MNGWTEPAGRMDVKELRVKAITFDLGDTLVSGKLDLGGFHTALLSLLRQRVGELEPRDLQSAIDAAFVNLAETQADGSEMKIEEVFRFALERLGCTAEDALLSRIKEEHKAYTTTTIYPGVEDVLHGLSGRYPLGMVCNTISDLPNDIVSTRGWGKYFKAVVLSRDAGFRKPRPEIFYRALDILEVEGEESVHVGDSLVSDVAGALTVGATPVWVNNGHESAWRGYTIKEVREISTLLEKIEKTR